MTTRRRTTYCPSWEDEFKYLRKVPNDKYWAFCVACNKTFLIDGSGKSQVHSHMFCQMFRDSNIAKGFSQNGTKMMYVLKFGLSPYFKGSLKNDFYSKAFCFKFDEMTTNQIKSIMMVLFSIGVNPKVRSQWHIVDHCLLITALPINLLNIFLPLLKKLT